MWVLEQYISINWRDHWTWWHTHTTLFAIKSSNNKKTNKTKKKKRNKTLQDKSNTTRQHISILGLIFSTQSTNDIIGYGELAQKIRFSITYAHRRQRKIKHFHAAGRNFCGSSIEYFHECAYNYIFQRLKVIIIIFICSDNTINDAQQRANDKTWTGQQGGKTTLTAALE